MVGSFLWRGLGLDVPGEGLVAAGSGAIDRRPGERRRSGVALAEVIVGCIKGARAWHG
jgi:hypothetical protein